MLTFFASFFQRVLSAGGILELLVEPKRSDDSKFICRDELIKKSASKHKSYYGDSFSQPLLKVKDEKRSSTAGFEGKPSSSSSTSGIRVKVKMTKQEAARLLSKCKDGGVLEFRDVAQQLANLPMDRVSVASLCPTNHLGSIPEEF